MLISDSQATEVRATRRGPVGLLAIMALVAGAQWIQHAGERSQAAERTAGSAASAVLGAPPSGWLADTIVPETARPGDYSESEAGAPEGVNCLDCVGAPEPESCGGNTNGGCNRTPAVYTDVMCGQTFCGTAFAHQGVRDTDWYRVVLPDLDGSGMTQLVVRLTAEIPCVAFVMSGECGSQFQIASTESDDCVLGTAESCLPSEVAYLVVVAPGTLAGGGIFAGFPCGESNDYRIKFECVECPPAAGCLNCPPPGMAEAESCGQSVNAGCDGAPAVFTQLDCGQTVCGTAWAHNAARDTDWYRVLVPDVDGSGFTGVTVTLVAELPVAAFLYNDNCANLQQLASVASDDCGVGSATACVASNVNYMVKVATGTLAGGIFNGFPCAQNNSYLLHVACGICPCAAPVSCCPADTNLDGRLNGEDVGTFVDALLNPPMCGTVEFCAADADENGLIQLADIGAFVQRILAGGDCPLLCNCGVATGDDEGEACGTNTNGGCNVAPQVFGAIACGQTICGTAWANANARDTDWYNYTHAAAGPLTATLRSDFPGIVFIVNSVCPASIIAGTNIGSSSGCGAVIPAVAPNLPAGNYRIFVSVGNPNGTPILSGYPCGGGQNGYALTLTCN